MSRLSGDKVEAIDQFEDMAAEKDITVSANDAAISLKVRNKIEMYFERKSFENQVSDEDYFDKYYDFDDLDQMEDELI